MGRRLRWVGGGYVAVMVVVAFWPTPVDRDAVGLIAAVVAWCHAHGLSFVSHSFFEQAGNVAFFVPFGLLLASLLRRGTRFVALGVCLAVSGTFELGQAVLLPDRFASTADVLFNTLGGAAGVIAFTLIERLARRRDADHRPRRPIRFAGSVVPSVAVRRP